MKVSKIWKHNRKINKAKPSVGAFYHCIYSTTTKLIAVMGGLDACRNHVSDPRLALGVTHIMIHNGHISNQEIETLKVKTFVPNFVVRLIVRFGVYSAVELNEFPLLLLFSACQAEMHLFESLNAGPEKDQAGNMPRCARLEGF
jgi:hypothetical protein